MTRALVAACAALTLTACADGRSVVTLTVTASDTVAAIDHVEVIATDVAHGRAANAVDSSVPGGMLPPAITLSYALPKTVRGTVHFAVTALAADGTTLATGATDVGVTPSTKQAGTVTLMPMVAVVKRHLAFTTPPPASAKPLVPLSPAVQVSILDDNNMPITAANDTITVALTGGSAGAFLFGHRSAAASNGVATFADLIVDTVGPSYTLTATATGLDPVTATFDVVNDVWVQVDAGLDAGSVSGFCFDPAHPMVIWATSRVGSGLWRSGDGGATWARRDIALGKSLVFSCAVGNDGATLLVSASSMLFRSDDDAASWKVIGSGLPGTSESLTIDPTNDAIVYAWLNSGLYKSTDRGATFAALSTQTFSRLLFDPASPTTIWAVSGATAATLTLQKSTDGGAHFAPSNSGLPAGAPVLGNTFAIAPSDPQTMYVQCNGTGGGLFKSTNGGSSWTLVSAAAATLAIVVDPASTTTLYAIRNGTAGVLAWRSTDSGANWTAMTGFAGSNSGLVYIDRGGRLWALAMAGSPYLSADKMTFTLSATGLRPYVATIATSQQFNSVWIGTAFFEQAFHSTTGGATWLNVSAGLNTLNFPTPAFRNVNGSVFDWDSNGIYRISDSTSSTMWTTVFDNVAAAVSYLAVDYDSTGLIILAVDANGAVQKSTNGGGAWTATGATIAMGSNGGVNVIVDRTNAMNAFIASGGSLFKTVNGGTMFSDVSPAPATHPEIASIAIDPVTSSNVYVANTAFQFFKSTNGGTSWSVVGQGLPATLDAIAQILIDPMTPSTIYVVTFNGLVYKSTDAATTFVKTAQPAASEVLSLAIDPNQTTHLFAATVAGVWRTTTSAQ